MEATWLPTAIRGGGRHESHDDVTATIATSRRGQYVSLSPELRAVPSARSYSRIIDVALLRNQQRDGAWSAKGKKREGGNGSSVVLVRREGLWTLLA